MEEIEEKQPCTCVESPQSLLELCLDSICDNLLTYIVPQIRTKDGWSTENPESSDCYDDEKSDKRYIFRDPEIFLITEISQMLMQKMLEKNLLCDATLNLFSEKNTKLRVVRLKNCKVSKNGLQILKQHKIVDLEAINLNKASVGDILDCLNEWSVANMVNANFSRCSFTESVSRFAYMIKVTYLKNLRSLNLSCTELNQMIFGMICDDLKHLEKLDISNTQVKDLKPLVLLKDKLLSLSLCDLSVTQPIIPTLKVLKNLRHLDLSWFNENNQQSLYVHSSVHDLLGSDDILPNLVSLDISGWKNVINADMLTKFIESHPKLRFLGLVLDSVNFLPSFGDRRSPNYPKHLTIAGLANEDQIIVTLERYLERSSYVQKALYHLFQLTSRFRQARPDIFNLVLPVMEAHSTRFAVQMGATACLYNLTRGELSKDIHPKALSKGVGLTLIAMETFPNEFQLQKNSLLTLCSDRILQEVQFDRFRCAKLVLDALCGFEDVNMNRMAVAICSILAAKVSTEETSELGARPVYMRKLLTMVQNRVDNKTSDITLKFTLSALWNLTDESSATCTVFLEQGGARLFLNVLKTFKNELAIETKVLGLLNNIAEVPRLRHCLLIDSLVEELHELLRSQYIDVSYFAAGIVAHLASDGEESWTEKSFSRSEMLKELENAVGQWIVPANEMVAYRSFRPFFPLLRIDMDYQVQLWAVWAIHHVCTKNPKRYCQMLCEERGNILLNDLINYSDTHSEIKNICTQVLKTLQTNGC